MSIVARTAKRSPRLFAICLLIALISTIAAASRWESVSTLIKNFGLYAQVEQFGIKDGESKSASETPARALIPQDTRTICNTGTPNFATLAAAVADANAAVPAGGRTYLVCAGHTETAPAGGYNITAAGASAANPVVFIKDGVGANPTITAGVGTSTTNDAIVKIIGADYITLDGFTLQESASNTTATTQVEWGIALLYATTTNGAQNITLQNNTITLNRTNINTFGIYSNSTHTNAAPTTSATATTTSGGNSGMKVYGNTISNVNMGIVVVGPTAAADANTGIDIGGAGGAQANSITNFGTSNAISTYANVSGTVNGILVRNSNGFNISFNTITSSVGGTTAGTLNGIQIPAASATPTTTFTNTINNNNISLQSAVTAGAINGINYPSGSASTTSTLNINSNNFATFGHTVAGASGAITFITTTSTNQFTTINSNTFTNMSVNTTGSVTFISQSFTAPATGTKAVNNNSIVTGFTKTGAGGTVTFVTDNGSTVAGAVSNCQNNNFSNVTLTGATAITGISYTDGGTAPTRTVSGNTLNNWTTGVATVNAMNFTYWNGTSSLSNNTITNINGQGAITGVTIGSTANNATSITIGPNTINNLISSGTGGAVTGITSSNTSTLINITGNTINTLSTTAGSLVSGITISGATNTNVLKNKIYDLSGSNASSTVSGITVSGGTIVSVFNNLIGDLRTPAANAANPLIGLNITGGTTVNAYYNTVYLNASSTGALFGSSAVSVSTTPTVELRNNVFVNASSVTGAGLAAAHRRSSTTLTTYASASNNNDFFGSTIFTDGTNTDTTIAAYKARVASRDSSSFSENPSFLSTTGSNANFLHVNPATPTQLESGGTAVSGITDDFDGQTRNSTTPDVGADEFTGTPLDLTPPSITYTTLAGTAQTTNRNLTVTITDASGVATGGNAPRIYFKKSTDTNYVSTPCTLASGTMQNGTWTCTIDYSQVGGGSVTTGDTIQYFVVAQDTNGNVAANPSAGFAATSVNNVTSPPTTPNSYSILPSISGNKTVGTNGDYATLTAAAADLNSKEITGPVTLTLTDPTYTETATVTFNANNGSNSTNTVTIKPASGVTSTISVSSTGCAISFNGADYMTIDGSNAAGGTSRDLTITNTNTGTSSAVVCLQSTAAPDGATNNVVKNTNVVGQANTTTLFGIFSGSSTVSLSSLGNGNNSNTIQNNNVSKTQYGIFSQGASAASKNTGNLITQNLLNSSGTSAIGRTGILVGFENNIQISQNTIDNISSSASTQDEFGISLGIQGITTSTFTGNEVTNALVNRNYIGAVRQTGTYSACGICVAPATSGTNTLRNNMIAGVSANGTVGDFSVGMLIGGGAGSTTNIYYNSISMSGTQTGGSEKSYALAIGGSNPVVDIQGNILYNTQNNGTGSNYALGLGYSTFTNLTSDYNDFFVTGSPTPATPFFTGGTGSISSPTNQATFANLQTATGKDTNSKNVNPLFISTTDLHLQPSSTLIDMGVTIASVTVDFDGQSRPQGAAYDIGADETVPSPGTLQFSSATYSATEASTTATITVTRAGGNSGAASVNYATSDGTTNGASGGASCTAGVDYITTSGMLNWTDGDTASKTFTVTLCNDGVSEPNETVNLTLSGVTGATLGTPSAAVLTIINSEIFGGSVNVGTTETYTSLTNPGGLFEAINNGSLSSNTTINITSDLTGETGAVALNQFASGFTLTIKPSGAARTVTGTAGATRLITLNGADNITIDGSLSGSTDRSLTLSNINTASGTTVVSILSLGTGAGATNNTVKNTIIQNGSNLNTGSNSNLGIFVGDTSGAAAGADNDNLTIQNNQIKKVNVGIQAAGVATTGVLDNLTIADNTFGDDVLADSLGRYGILVSQATGANITRNTIKNVTSTNSGIAPSNNVTGIVISTGTLNTSVTRNNITGIRYASTGGYGGKGIDINTGNATSNLTVANNFISDIRGDGWNTLDSDSIVGLRIGGTTGGVNVYFNSVNLGSGNFAGNSSGTLSSAFHAGASVTNLDVRNNIFSTNLNNTTVTTDKTYAVSTLATTNGLYTVINYNDYFVSGTPGFVGLLNSVDRLTLANWQTATAQDANSLAVNPLFISSTDLHLQATSPLESQGTSIGAVTVDFDGDARPNPPDIGADEIPTPPAGTIQFSSATYSVGEGGGTVTLTVTRTGGSNGAVTVNYALSGGTATGGASCTAGVDYINTGGSVSFVNGDAADKSFNVTICDDATFENPDETFNATLSIGSGSATLGTPNPATVTINDNDSAPAPVINVSPTSIPFGDQIVNTTSSQQTVTITNNGTSNLVLGTLTVTGSNPGDFSIVNNPSGATVTPGNNVQFQVTFTPSAAGARSASITIPNNDSTNPNPTVSLSGTGIQPGTLQFSSATYSIGEAGPTATITVTRTGGSEGTVGISYATVAGGTATGGATCTAGVDYLNAGGTLSWTNGESTSKTFTVSVCNDNLFESDETVNLALSVPTGGATLGTQNTAVLTINENDTAPTFQFSSATYTNSDDIAAKGSEGDEAVPEVAMITVTRTGATENAVSVNYATVTGGTATGGASCTAGVDYVSTNGTLNFAAGDTSKTFDITVCTDALFEGDETVNLALSSPTAPAVLGTPNTAVLTITDNDLQPSLQFSSATYSNSDDIAKYGITTDEFAPSVATITVTRTGALGNVVAVNYATSNGTATGGTSCSTGVDYISTNGTLNFAAGDTSKTFDITVCTDALFEGDETVNLTLSNPTGGAALGTPNSAVLTIVDNDAQPSLQFSAATYSVGEGGGSATITVTRTGAPDNAVSVSYATVTGGTATGGSACAGAVDYLNTSGTLSFAAGENSKTFSVSICDDASAESTETVNLALSSPTGAVLGAQNTAVLSILDNDSAPTLQFSSATYSAAENLGTVTLTVTRSGATGNALTVDYGTGGGTATAGACAPGVDYNTATGTLNFGSGESSKTFDVTICNDSVYELSQTFNATLSNPTGGATLGTPNPATVTITNDDAAPTVAINDISQAEGNSGTTNFQTSFTVSGASEVAGGFNFQTADDTATSPTDYTAVPSTAVVIPANVNRTTATLNSNIVLVNGDTTVEPDETFFLNGSGCTDCSFTDNQGLATIVNDDATFQFSSATSSVGEGAGSITLTVTRSGLTTGAASVDFATANGTAAGGTSCGANIDFVNNSGTLNFASGDVSKTFNVTLCDDAEIETIENFTATLSNPTGALIGTPSTQTVTITDNDTDTTAPVISYTPIPNNPSSTSLTATVTDAVGVTGVTIFWRINGGSYTSAACSSSGGTPKNGTWLCIITGAPNPSAVSYYVTATDAAANTGSNPTGGVSAPNVFTIGAATIPAGAYTNLNLGSGVSLGGNVSVSGNLALSGVVSTGIYKLTLGCGAAITGGGESGYVAGDLERFFCTNETFTFHTGAATSLLTQSTGTEALTPESGVSNYSPLTVNVTGGEAGSSLTVSVTDTFMDGSVQSGSLSRYWTLTENGNLTATLTFTYRDEDVVGTESTYNVLRRANGVTADYPGGTVNPASNTFTAPNVSNFSQWSAGLAVPSAANAEIRGRLLTANGEGIRNATVMLQGGRLTQPVYVRTNTFGNYLFTDLPVGETYVVTVISSRYTFANPSRIVYLADTVTDENFIADSQ